MRSGLTWWLAMSFSSSMARCSMLSMGETLLFLMARLVQLLVGSESQEFLEIVVGDDRVEQPRRVVVPALDPGRLAHPAPQGGQLLAQHGAEEIERDLPPVLEDPLRVADPLPHLGAGDLGGGSVLHQ